MTTDVGTTPRKKLTPLKRLKIFEAHQGICALCSRKIGPAEPWIVEHMRALELGGADHPDNMRPVHGECARPKTQDDNARASKAKRCKAKSLGLIQSRNPLPGGRNSQWKKTFRYGWIRRTDQ